MMLASVHYNVAHHMVTNLDWYAQNIVDTSAKDLKAKPTPKNLKKYMVQYVFPDGERQTDEPGEQQVTVDNILSIFDDEVPAYEEPEEQEEVTPMRRPAPTAAKRSLFSQKKAASAKKAI